MRILLSLLGVVIAATVASAQPALDIYHVDVEGGAATLIVSPGRESLLVDAGWPGNDGRDVDRIQAAMKAAGITRIDHLIVTHYHTDHVGGLPPLVGGGADWHASTITAHDRAVRPRITPRATRRMSRPCEDATVDGRWRRHASAARPTATPVSLAVVAANGKVVSRASARRNPGAAACPPRPTTPATMPAASRSC